MIQIDRMRSPCPIANALEIVGDKWTLLILRDAFSGKNIYSEFQASPEGIPTNILADRLKRLVSFDILKKTPYQQHPVRFSYHLTEKGRSLAPLLKEISNWGLTHISQTDAKIKIDWQA
ncbi:MAG: helix-turn-helix transcriptional regulator [Burkholderiales bacterium]|nr:helix-turn-helix transcriptional regulator [Burkholderiales bacterium]MDR4516382.1 helix-turn-helix transcriptional regulator [Nitrosomonas sp.]